MARSGWYTDRGLYYNIARYVAEREGLAGETPLENAELAGSRQFC